MPQAIPIAISAVAGWGTSAIAGGALGSALAGFASGAIGGAITGAVIGAGLGALTAAVMDGDIGRGALFGAVGGAVSGGLVGWSAGADSLASGTAMENISQSAIDFELGIGTPEAVGSTIEKTGGGLLSKIPESAAGSLVEGGMTLAAGMLSGYDEGKEAEATRDWQAEQAALARQHDKDMAQLSASLRSGGGGGGSDALGVARIQQQTAREQLAEQRRQYDTDMQESRMLRKKAGATLAQVRASRKGKAAPKNAPGVERQMSEVINEVNTTEVA